MSAVDTQKSQPVLAGVRRLNQRKRGIIALMIGSLVASAGARFWVDDARSAAIPHRGEDAATSSLGGMNSFALGLLLGGLRGPLVMILWVQSETQKTDKNLEGVDTQIEWIRLLQPEFDTVHIFQIWNKAYNISVQMASRANKYSVILSALDYAHSVDQSKPEDINIVAATGQLYFDKLGYSAEKFYYRKRIREETGPKEPPRSKQASGTRTRLDPLCDDQGFLFPAMTRPRYDHAPRTPAETEYDDGAELQYLKQFEPFRDGVSTFALAYNYYKRSEVLQSKFLQEHAQLSDQVVDSRPALALKFWTDEALDQGRRREFAAFGFHFPENEDDNNLLNLIQFRTAFDRFKDRDGGKTVTLDDAWLDRPSEFDPANGTAADKARERSDRQKAFQLAIWDYDEAVRAAALGEKEYVRHIINYPQQEALYESHRLQMGAQAALAAGDRDFLKAMLASGSDRQALVVSATAQYKKAIDQSGRSLFKYFIDSAVSSQVLPPGFGQRRIGNQRGIDDMTEAQVLDAVYKEDASRAINPRRPQNIDRYEFDRYIGRARTRLDALGSPTPGMSLAPIGEPTSMPTSMPTTISTPEPPR